MEEKKSFKERFMAGMKNISDKIKESMKPVDEKVVEEIASEVRSFKEGTVFTFNELLEQHNITNNANKMDYVSELLGKLENDIEEEDKDSAGLIYAKKYVKKVKVEITVQ